MGRELADDDISQSGMEQLKTYGEMMNKFAETWGRMYNMPK